MEVGTLPKKGPDNMAQMANGGSGGAHWALKYGEVTLNSKIWKI